MSSLLDRFEVSGKVDRPQHDTREYASLLSKPGRLHYSLAMRSALSLQNSQQLTMSPHLQRAIRLLQLSAVELEQELQRVLERNLLLEQVDAPQLRANYQEGLESYSDQVEGMDYLQDLSSLGDYRKPLPLQPLDNPQKNPELSLQEYVRQQMAIQALSTKEQAIAEVLIDALSEEGYLCASLQVIQKSLSMEVKVQEIDAVLAQIQQCEPLGIGARTLSECLAIQLRALPADTPWLEETSQLVHHYLEVLARRDLSRLMSDLGLDAPSLQAVIRLLTALNPKPGHQIGSQDPGYLVPDLLLHQRNGHMIVELNRELIPRLRINADYLTLLKSSNARNTDQQSFATHLKEARWFLKSLKTRYETLIKVSRYIVEYQRDFFERGLEAMKPLSLHAVAQAVGLHASTISRITTHKYIHTPKGLLELKYFFSAALPSKEGAMRSSTSIRAIIKDLIEEESCYHPLSDHAITARLADLRVHIARRTVTKYRKSMKIPRSQDRKKTSSL